MNYGTIKPAVSSLATRAAAHYRGIVGAIALAMSCGCAPPPPTIDDLGQIVYDVSQVPGHDRPYHLPQGLGDEPPMETDPESGPGDASAPE